MCFVSKNGRKTWSRCTCSLDQLQNRVRIWSTPAYERRTTDCDHGNSMDVERNYPFVYSCQADVDAAVGGSLDDLYNYHPQSMEFFGNGTMYICTATSGKTSSLTHWMINYRHSATKFKTFLNLSSR
ncbi:hypothetical protein LENED_006922 [Lentinula edodes]|uniref:Uncharacterized protein n=1 Tax=Lentinula edodes TaxID=5353 RepID=A0A1Q3ED03_LENED|nr:hypothetical protein LENED_006922 [Lentinula edodes]